MSPFDPKTEMTDALILIQDHDSIIRLLERSQQDVGIFRCRLVVQGHQGLDPAQGTLSSPINYRRKGV